MIQVKIPEFAYKETVILKDIDECFETSKTHGIIGLNGAGKTTFFNLISGQLNHPTCNITVHQEKTDHRMISHIDTDPFFYKNLTAREFLNVFKAHHATYNEQRLSELLKLELDKLIEEYSTGMRKKLLLLSQIKQNKSIFILDEPFNGLDLETNKIMEVIIHALNKKGKTVFISSHILDPLLNVCHGIYHIKDQTISKKYLPQDYHLIDKELFGAYTQSVKEELDLIL